MILTCYHKRPSFCNQLRKLVGILASLFRFEDVADEILTVHVAFESCCQSIDNVRLEAAPVRGDLRR